MSEMLNIFQEKALRDLSLSLLDWETDRKTLPRRVEATAELMGCTPAQVVAHLHSFLCSLMQLPRTLGVFGLPMLDIEAAKEDNRQALREWGGTWHRQDVG